MPVLEGPIRKMTTDLLDPVGYQLPVGDQMLKLNPLIGKEIAFSFAGAISCIACGRKTKKSFNQGHCYPCFKRLASCDQCIIKPELCHFHEGTCREPEWGKKNCFAPHIVYLANSSGLKVGITRASQVPTRWIDQGAIEALPMFEVIDRRTTGLIEHALRSFISDRTDWRKMLKGDPDSVDLVSIRAQLMRQLEEMVDAPVQIKDEAFAVPSTLDTVCHIRFPVHEYPEKVKSHNFDKDAKIAGNFFGIKGQYLMIDGKVFNVRKFAGYEMEITF